MNEPTVDRAPHQIALLQAQPQPLRQCKRCGADFEPQVIDLAGLVSITTMICRPCSKAIEIEQDQAEANRRLSQVERSQRLRDANWVTFCPREFRLTTEGDGKTELAKLELRQPKVKELVQWKLGEKGWLIRGETGSCKTRSVWRLIRRLWCDNKSVCFLTAVEFDHQCRDAGGDFTLTCWRKRLEDCDVFVLDDLGSGAWTENTSATFFQIVGKRVENGKPIFTTTQHTGESLKEQSEADRTRQLRTEAMIRRLREYCAMHVFQ